MSVSAATKLKWGFSARVTSLNASSALVSASWPRPSGSRFSTPTTCGRGSTSTTSLSRRSASPESETRTAGTRAGSGRLSDETPAGKSMSFVIISFSGFSIVATRNFRRAVESEKFSSVSDKMPADRSAETLRCAAVIPTFGSATPVETQSARCSASRLPGSGVSVTIIKRPLAPVSSRARRSDKASE